MSLPDLLRDSGQFRLIEAARGLVLGCEQVLTDGVTVLPGLDLAAQEGVNELPRILVRLDLSAACSIASPSWTGGHPLSLHGV
jgi:hypothetical protein